MNRMRCLLLFASTGSYQMRDHRESDGEKSEQEKKCSQKKTNETSNREEPILALITLYIC